MHKEKTSNQTSCCCLELEFQVVTTLHEYNMELRTTEEEVRFLATLYESLCTSTSQHACTTSSSSSASDLLPALPTLSESEKLEGASPSEPLPSRKTAAEILEGLELFRRRVELLRDVTDKFRTRLTLRDPVSDQPRYGAQTSKRVIALLRVYQDLCRIVLLLFGDITAEQETDVVDTRSIVNTLRQLAAKERDEMQRVAEEQRWRAVVLEEARIAAEEEARRAHEQALAAQTRREQEAAETVARQAADVRDVARRAQEQAAAANRDWFQNIPHRKTLQGVQEQLRIFSDHCHSKNNNNNSNRDDSLNAVHTIFSQIMAHPEDVKFRRIRRDHPRFINDIGQYTGGRELLIAAGFELGFVEEIPSFVCKEPDVEKDLDGWSAWFDLLKGTLELIEQEMIK